jgi:hypothetical protein
MNDSAKIASLELQVAANKALVSDYAVRAQQAEQAANRAIATTQRQWTDAQVKAFAALITEHMERRAQERAIHQQAILQATLLALNEALKADAETQKAMLQTIVRETTTAVQHISNIEKKEKRPDTSK